MTLRLSGACNRRLLPLVARVLGLVLLGMLAPAACAPSAPQTVSMRLHGQVPDASVIIDDSYVGTLAAVQERGVALPPGKHRITVEKPGYFPWDKLVVVAEGDAPLRLEVVLQPLPQ